MISAQSRYAQGTLVRLQDSTGAYQLSVTRSLPPVITAAFSLYTWQAGDRPDIVASETLGDPSLWWSIVDMNPEIINPLTIPAGTTIRVPVAPIMGQGTTVQ